MIRHYRSEDGIVGYEDGDLLIDDTTGGVVRCVSDGRGLCLEPATARYRIGIWHDGERSYRAAYIHDCVLTAPEHSALTDHDLRLAALAEELRHA